MTESEPNPIRLTGQMANQPSFRDFYAMTVRAVMAIRTDGIVFDDGHVDSFETKWEKLDPETRQRWRDLAELLDETNQCRIRLRVSQQLANTSTPRKEIH